VVLATPLGPDHHEHRTFAMANKEIDIDNLRRLLQYDAETGSLIWLPRPLEMFPSERHWKRWNTCFAWKPALGSLDAHGYLTGRIFNSLYKAHRVAWALATGAWPTADIDHINGTRDDNRLENLRSVSRQENLKNRRLSSNNTSGAHGVSLHKQAGKWRARISVDNKEISLGLFETKEQAILARQKANADFNFHASHGRR